MRYAYLGPEGTFTETAVAALARSRADAAEIFPGFAGACRNAPHNPARLTEP